MNKIVSLDDVGKTSSEIMAVCARMSESELTANIIFRIIRPSLETALATEEYFRDDLKDMPRIKLRHAADLVAKEIIALIVA